MALFADQIRWWTSALMGAPLLLVTACQAPGDSKFEATPSEQLHELAQVMTGTFDSYQQSAQDPDNFFEIRLVMVPIWLDQSGHDQQWLYVEQAAASALDSPYRQRVYRLAQTGGGEFTSEVFELPDAERFVGAWQEMELFDSLTPSDLAKREGCAIYLQRAPDGSWHGATRGAACRSTLAGAAYATSQVSIQDGLLVSWDRGFDADDQQVWGAEKGGYRFVQSSSRAPGIGQTSTDPR